MLFHYEVDVHFSHEYLTTEPSGKSSLPSGSSESARPEKWEGRSVRAAVAAAGVKLGAQSIDAQSGGLPVESGELSRGDAGLEQRGGHCARLGFHSLTHLSASAICSGVMCVSTTASAFPVMARASAELSLACDILNHL